ncbi:hypothetical protein FN846DRAFT_660036 [Sphaerosporella brunnea]|uniref:Uncharacterized protein n=1 Tax=Sphaerosporella brunnea TaxID=1250544 RepID=A0A5J5EZW1_9PEZI|nr:hypothetical protein FN846DRAFT_660036 [Sphaerosporella brunnea]
MKIQILSTACIVCRSFRLSIALQNWACVHSELKSGLIFNSNPQLMLILCQTQAVLFDQSSPHSALPSHRT